MRLSIKVKPNARANTLRQDAQGQWQARLAAAPVDGKANAALIGLLADHFRCRKADIRILAGTSGRQKWVELPDRAPPQT